MTTADKRGWGHPGAPGSAQERSYRQQHIVVIEAGGVRLAVRREVSRLFKGFIDDLIATGYRLDVNADDWGFNNRDIRGRPGVKSNHAWGLAIDLNAIDNPMTEAHSGHANQPGHDHRGVHTDMPPETARLAAKWGLTWGANYRGTRKDCLAGDTLLITADGPIPIRDLAGRTAEVLSTTTDPRSGVVESEWVKAPIRSYGFDRTYVVSLRRRGAQVQVRATANHRWPVRHGKKVRFVTTAELLADHRPGDTVPALEYPAMESTEIDPDAVAQGIVWGDGSVYNRHGGRNPQAYVQLCGTKRELRPFLEPHARYWKDRDGEPAAWGLPAGLKSIPDPESPLSVLAGFFAGWFACDGHTDKEAPPTLSTSSDEAVAWLRTVAPRLGLTITSVSTQPAGRSGFHSTKPNHQVAFRSIDERLLVRAKHRDNHPGARRWFGWTVESVADSGLVEEVFCPTVAGRHVVAIATPTVPLLTGQSMHVEFEGEPDDVGRYPNPANRPAPPPPTEEDLMPVLPMLTVPTICVTEGGGWVLYRPQSGVVEVLDDELLSHYRNLGCPTWERVPGEPHRVPQHLFESWVDAAHLKD